MEYKKFLETEIEIVANALESKLRFLKVNYQYWEDQEATVKFWGKQLERLKKEFKKLP